MRKFILYCCILCTFGLANGTFPKVAIGQGVLRGKIRSSLNNRIFYSFTGIPYAKPPIGFYRFEPPQPFGKWKGIYNATESHARCLQFGSGSIIGDEDCLYLNIYTPKVTFSRNELLPVMFYIHGGAFNMGFAEYEKIGPQMLMNKDIVLVTVNYRLGPLGFFSTGDEVVPGNIGLKDQAFALRWIKRNIRHFGGDPKKITVFGQSAGGVSAHLHMFTPLHKDVVQGVIAQSGTAFSRWALIPLKDIQDHSSSLADIVGCKKESNEDMVKCLKALQGADIMKAMPALNERKRSHSFYFGPTVEPSIKGAFLSKDPIDAIKLGEAADVPFITGVTSEDGSFLVPDLLTEMPEKDNREKYLETAIPVAFWYSMAADALKANLTKAITEYYLGNDPINFSALDRLIKMYTEALFFEGAYESIKIHRKYSNRPIYYYLFGYRGSETNAKTFNMENRFGVAHADDLLYLFNNTVTFPSYTPTESDTKVMKLLTTLWTNFASYGNPTPPQDTLLSVKWKPVENNTEYYYHFKQDTTVECRKGLFTKDVRFWTNLRDTPSRMKILSELQINTY